MREVGGVDVWGCEGGRVGGWQGGRVAGCEGGIVGGWEGGRVMVGGSAVG